MGHISEGKFEILIKGEDFSAYYSGEDDIEFKDRTFEVVIEREGTYEMSFRNGDDYYEYGSNYTLELKSFTPSFSKHEIDLLSMNGKDWKKEVESHLLFLAEQNNDYDFC